ncbi:MULTISPECIES: FAD-dependent monooxygenase [Niastella]|uniref:FAD-dependent monooxygenase n=1 Tax=Niastella soli TaxID=2821487 RepID=A0ABS3YSX7_9BACT|nr:FAD-dependent monooxygenase [Niastella soli]MBO9200993.1 FAD-dependent monooxygenase [Niastella soli]
MQNKSIPVLIVGGGLTGLTAALFLLKHGVRSLLIERRATTSIHPRARGFDVRTMELFRELQLHQAIVEAGKALAPAWGLYQGESLVQIVKDIDPAKMKVNHPINFPGLEKLAAMSPVAGARCTQDLSEPILLQAAQERGADIRFNTKLLLFTQSEGDIIAQVQDTVTGQEEIITCQYMIAADGAGSPIRKTLQAATSGHGSYGHLLNIYFDADLGAVVKGREFSICRIEQPDIHGILTSINNSDKWVFHLYYDPAKGERPEDYTSARLEKLIQQMLGMPQIKVRIISVLPWQPTVSVVNEMQHGRILLAGDAAHQMTPYGGKGAATGVQDVQNLAWKLAMVLQKQAGAELLQTYSNERQPVGMQVAEMSGLLADDKGLLDIPRFMKLVSSSPNEYNLDKMVTMVGLPDFRYASSAIINNEQEEVPALLSGQPGTRIPHVWLQKGPQPVSTLDLATKHLTLISDEAGLTWELAAKEVAEQLQIPLRVHIIHQEDPAYGPWKEISRMQAGEVMLVRPDGFVAWRQTLSTANAAALLKEALKKLLAINESN